jgi:hypothetical protein
MKVIQKTLYTTWGKDKVTFASAYPKVSETDSINTPIITYSLITKRPAEFNKTTEIKPRIRETIKSKNLVDNDADLKAIDVYGQMFDYYIEFQVWAETGEEADITMENFQEFMFKYTGYFKKLGVNEILFEEANANQDTAKWRSELINRNLIYRIRIDEIVGVVCPAIENIEIYPTLDGIHFEVRALVLTEEQRRKAGKAIRDALKGKIEGSEEEDTDPDDN